MNSISSQLHKYVKLLMHTRNRIDSSRQRPAGVATMSRHKFFVAFAVSTLLGSALAQAAATRAGGQDAGGAAPVAERCAVRIDRNPNANGTFSVTRMVLDSGRCVCIAATGQSSQGGSAESAVDALRRAQSCADAPPAVAEASGGGVSGTVLGVVGAGVLLGVGVGVAGGSDSPGS
jgi:hypothetical protein